MFILTYCMKGMTCGDVENMLSVDRKWYLERLYKQLKKESEEIKRTSKGSTGTLSHRRR
jgi:hypothetical protein